MRKFKTESKKLLDLMINSIYTNREIFLRELISNSSDAVDKLYFRSLVDEAVKINRADLAITVAFDEDARTVTVSDNGIGMTKDDLDKNLGTIAHSDSFEFKQGGLDKPGLDDVSSDGDVAADVDIIGQFGVGFYSAFMVGRKVRVVSRAYGSDEAWAWESDGVDGYTIEAAERSEHGTDVIVFLKADTDEESYGSFATESGLKSLIKKYSNYVRYPIQMEVTKSRMKERPADAGDDHQPEFENYTELETVNSMVPIWKRKKQDVTDEEYNEFYKTDFHDFEDPLRTLSLHAEGTLTYDALMYLPSHAPFDMWSKDYKRGLALYSSGVLIMDKCEELVPDYFNFVRGVVDSADLTLNISRETLQHNSQLRAIARRLEKKIKSELSSMCADDREAYTGFFKEFGRTLKYGIYSSYGMAKDTLADLLLFYSAKQEKMVTLDEYVASAPADAEAIYFAAGDSVERLAAMPIVTTVLAKGYDVLLCDESVDEFCMMALADYTPKDAVEPDGSTKAWPIKNVGGEDLGLTTEEEKKKAEEATEENADLFSAMADALAGKVKKVAVSTRVTEAPVMLTTEGAVSLQMAHLLKEQPGSDEGVPEAQIVMEVNVDHPVFQVLKDAQASGNAQKVADYTGILFDQALLVEGLPINDPLRFAERVSALMV